MRLVIKNSIQLCLRTLVFSIVLRYSNYNNRIISIGGIFLGHPVDRSGYDGLEARQTSKPQNTGCRKNTENY